MLFSDSQIDSVYTEKIVDAQTRSMPVMTRRDVWLPQVQGKALAVIGMRRAGKTTFLWQLMAQRDKLVRRVKGWFTSALKTNDSQVCKHLISTGWCKPTTGFIQSGATNAEPLSI